MADVNPAPNKISVLLAVSVRLYRDGLTTTLDAQPALSVSGAAATSWEVLELARAHKPDVVIVDVAFDDAVDLIRALKSERGDTRILAFAVREDLTAVLEYAAAGADGFVTPHGSITELTEAIKRTVAGELLCSPRLAAQLLRRAAHRVNRSVPSAHTIDLTIREDQVYRLLRRGHSNKEIASRLNVAEATVKNHVHHVLEKLHVTSRAQVAAIEVRVLKASLPAINASRRTS